MEKNKKKQITPAKAMERLETLCARSEHSVGELQMKLRTWGINPDDARDILESLQKRRYVDDVRFARAYTRDKLRFSRWGRAKIRIGLMSKRVKGELIGLALEEIDENEYREVLMAVLRAKMRTIEDVESYEGKTRLFRYGVSRGFEMAEVSNAIRSKALWDLESR